MNWARELSRGLVSTQQMVDRGLLNSDEKGGLEKVKSNFDFRVPATFLDQNALLSPELSKQFIPSTQELIFAPEELSDPIGDERWSPVECVTHRYPNRALLKVTYQCASYCRFCFRRYKVSDSQNNLSIDELEPAFQYLENNSEIWEVVLTGGDPLVLSDKKINLIMQRLSIIKHIKVLRFHTRIPTVLPTRVTSELIDILKSSQKTLWVVMHVNSAAELNAAAQKAIATLVNAGLPVLAQSVLLKGVNDSVKQLSELFTQLVEHRVRPYYLHYPDLAQGTGHFRIPLFEAVNLVQTLRGKLSGICVPQLIVDIPGGHGKVPLEPQWAEQKTPNIWEFISPLTRETVTVTYPTTP